MRVLPDPSLLAVTAAGLLLLPSSVSADRDSSVNVALKASFPPAPYLVELLYDRPPGAMQG